MRYWDQLRLVTNNNIPIHLLSNYQTKKIFLFVEKVCKHQPIKAKITISFEFRFNILPALNEEMRAREWGLLKKILSKHSFKHLITKDFDAFDAYSLIAPTWDRYLGLYTPWSYTTLSLLIYLNMHFLWDQEEGSIEEAFGINKSGKFILKISF